MKRIWLAIRSQSFMAVVTIMSVIFAIYQTFYYERKGEISITVAPPAKVLDIHKAVGGLEVSYAGENLRDTKKTLWVISATIRNEGNAEIRKIDFDENDPVGFLVEKGKLVDTPSLRTSVEYLRRNFTLNQIGNKITLSPSIIESGDTVFVSFLVLGDEVDKPSISPLGKIAGTPAIQFRNAESQHNSTTDNFVVTDSWWIQPVRMAIYTFAFLVSLAVVGSIVAAVLVPLEKFKSAKKKSQRRASIDKYKRGEAVTREIRAVGLMYIEEGENALFKVIRVLKMLRQRAELRMKLEGACSDKELDEIVASCYKLPAYARHLMTSLTELGFILSETSSLEQVGSWFVEVQELSEHLELDPNKDFISGGWDDVSEFSFMSEDSGALVVRNVTVKETKIS
jgi:hypothetical protein